MAGGIAVLEGLSSTGLALALQLIGRPFEEAKLFQTARVIEKNAGRFIRKSGGNSETVISANLVQRLTIQGCFENAAALWQVA